MPPSLVPAVLATALPLCDSALPCSVRFFALAALGPGQPAMAGLIWHCSVQVSKLSAPPAPGDTAWANSNQANCAVASPLPTAGAADFAGMAPGLVAFDSVAAGSAAPAVAANDSS